MPRARSQSGFTACYWAHCFLEDACRIVELTLDAPPVRILCPRNTENAGKKSKGEKIKIIVMPINSCTAHLKMGHTSTEAASVCRTRNRGIKLILAFACIVVIIVEQTSVEKGKNIVQAFGTLSSSSFLPNDLRRRRHFGKRSSSCLYLLKGRASRGQEAIKLPLLVLTNEENPKTIRPVEFPMPASHLPVTEMTTINLYGTELTSAAHIRMVQAAMTTPGQSFGYIVWKNPLSEDSQSDLIGAIGVICQIVSNKSDVAKPASSSLSDPYQDMFPILKELEKMSPFDDSTSPPKFSDLDEETLPAIEELANMSVADASSSSSLPSSSAVNILFRGSFRFIVRRVESIFPYPVAIVDELIDDPEIQQGNATKDDQEKEDFGLTSTSDSDEEDDEDEVDDDMYSELSSRELTFRCLNAMKTLVKMKFEKNPDMTPLEKEIIKTFRSETESSSIDKIELERASAEEMACMLEIFHTELVEITDVTLRRYAIGMMMCEVGDLSFEARLEALRTTDGIKRLQNLLAILEGKIGLARAKSMAQQISDTADGDKKQLKVGQPSLPPWANQIREGVKVEYFWNEKVGWYPGTVKGVIKVVDEILVTVEFDDGETHRLPFNGYEKARWRPGA